MLAVVLAGLWAAALAALFLLRYVQPASTLFLIFAVFMSFIVALCAAALSHLVLKAYELKKENELTI